MHRMPELKKSAESVQAYLSGLGLALSATQRLELVARARGFKSYNAAAAEERAKPSNAQTPSPAKDVPELARVESLADLFSQEAVDYVELAGRRYSIRYYNGYGLTQVADGLTYDDTQDLTADDIAIELESVEDGRVYEESLTLGQLDAARYTSDSTFTVPCQASAGAPAALVIKVFANKPYVMAKLPGPFFLYQEGSLYSMIPSDFDDAKLIARSIRKNALKVEVRDSRVITGKVLYLIQRESETY